MSGTLHWFLWHSNPEIHFPADLIPPPPEGYPGQPYVIKSNQAKRPKSKRNIFFGVVLGH